MTRFDRKVVLFFSALIVVACIWLLCSLHGNAQTAKVIPLSSADAKEAAELHAQQKAIEAKLEALRKRIEATLAPHSPGAVCVEGSCFLPNGSGAYTDPFYCGFEYSDDFKYIVPKPCLKPPTNCTPSFPNCVLVGGATYVAAPASGSSSVPTYCFQDHNCLDAVLRNSR